jgi:hypothetical protein
MTTTHTNATVNDTVTIDCRDCGDSIDIPLGQEPPVWCDNCDWEVSGDDWNAISRAVHGVGGVTR